MTDTDVYNFCQCGNEFTEDEWDLLPFVRDGVKLYKYEGKEIIVEFKNCPCGSTLCVEYKVEIGD